MIDIQAWMKEFLKALSDTFAERVWFVGLQGSYARGEATEKSDIDVVVILDRLSASDIKTYREMLDTVSHRELICGFLSGKNELLSWEPSDLFQFYYDTTPIFGTLDALLPLPDDIAVARAIRIGACNVYHGCVHNMVHERSEELLRGLYKAASFVVQATVFQQTGAYISRQRELLPFVSDEEQGIIHTFLYLKNGGAVELESMSEALFVWAQTQIEKRGREYVEYGFS